ncbi:MAG TPA: aminoacyl-tRNA hydrolase [Stellaceae bacterium]|nr:aminoacyl-tRNA hydrolase [Stellaceae bacterium]
MRLLVGLGNPGASYQANRHNIGFMAVEAIARRHEFGPWRTKFKGELAEGKLGREKVLALKPQTFMNLSGVSVGEAAHFHKIEPASIIVLHDEIDLAAGKVKVKQGGGAAGHNGLRSIDQAIGPDYWRIRLGVGHPGAKELVYGHVLSDFSAADRVWLAPLLEGVAEALPDFIATSPQAFTTKLALVLKNGS